MYKAYIYSNNEVLEIKIKDTNILLGFISTQTHVSTWNNFKRGKIQNHPFHKIDFTASGLETLYIYTLKRWNF